MQGEFAIRDCLVWFGYGINIPEAIVRIQPLATVCVQSHFKTVVLSRRHACGAKGKRRMR
jgi:hypothetical protein